MKTTPEWTIPLLAVEAMPYIRTRYPTHAELENALMHAYAKLESQLTMESRAELYCDFDARFSDYMQALRDRIDASSKP